MVGEASTMMEQVVMRQPRIWVLLDDRPGHQTQAIGLADRLGLPFETKILSFNWLNELPNPLMGASLLSVDRRQSDSLEAPYPDIVIAMGRRCLPVARWIKRSSKGQTRLVHIGRKGVTAADDFALLISCAHFNMPPHPHRLAVTLPPTQVTKDRLAKAREDWASLISSARTPRIVLLVGGETALHTFPPGHAIDLVRRAEAATEAEGGSLTVVTSRRTSPEAVEAMQGAARYASFHLWHDDKERNPYLGYLAWADALIVTGESESMLAEAASTGKPLHIAPMPHKQLGLKSRIRRGMTAFAYQHHQLPASLCRALFNSGWITPCRDLEKMHALIYEAGLAHPFKSELHLSPPAENRTSEPFVERMSDIISCLKQPSITA